MVERKEFIDVMQRAMRLKKEAEAKAEKIESKIAELKENTKKIKSDIIICKGIKERIDPMVELIKEWSAVAPWNNTTAKTKVSQLKEKVKKNYIDGLTETLHLEVRVRANEVRSLIDTRLKSDNKIYIQKNTNIDKLKQYQKFFNNLLEKRNIVKNLREEKLRKIKSDSDEAVLKSCLPSKTHSSGVSRLNEHEDEYVRLTTQLDEANNAYAAAAEKVRKNKEAAEKLRIEQEKEKEEKLAEEKRRAEEEKERLIEEKRLADEAEERERLDKLKRKREEEEENKRNEEIARLKKAAALLAKEKAEQLAKERQRAALEKVRENQEFMDREKEDKFLSQRSRNTALRFAQGQGQFKQTFRMRDGSEKKFEMKFRDEASETKQEAAQRYETQFRDSGLTTFSVSSEDLTTLKNLAASITEARNILLQEPELKEPVVTDACFKLGKFAKF